MADVEFRVEVVPERDAVRVRPVGELDMRTVPYVRAQLEELRRAGTSRTILDFSGTTFMDSSGLSMTLDLHRAASADGTELSIVAGPPAVQRAFDLVGLTELLPFLPDGDPAR